LLASNFGDGAGLEFILEQRQFGLSGFDDAVNASKLIGERGVGKIVKAGNGVPAWLSSRIDLAAQTAKESH
jgi:hypothetical protein